MQFIDKTKIIVKAGDGGNGKSAFRREKFIPKGGPSGGDGGRGGNIVLKAFENVNTLLDFRYHRKFTAKNGENGDIKNQFGKNAPDTIIKVPCGTVVKDADTNETLADLLNDGDEVIIAKGGRGGRGNAKFSNSANRAPTFAELGEPGEGKTLLLELKLLADVGLVGYPSVGKSSLIASVSKARPEIADYHFTTLTPVLGVVSVGIEQNFVMADIPGLIEGAAEGVGLGHDFLRHIERTKLIVHVLDASGIEGRDPVEDFYKINHELKKYNEKLSKREQILVANKMDLPSSYEHIEAVKELAKKENLKLFEISAATKMGTDELIRYIYHKLEEIKAKPIEEEIIPEKIYTTKEDSSDDISIKRDMSGTGFVVEGKNLEKLVAMTNFANDEALRRFQYIWRMKNIDQLLKDRGIKEGDTVKIGEMEFEYKE